MEIFLHYFIESPFNAIFSIISLIVGIAGLTYAIYTNRFSKELKKQLNSITWQDLENAANIIAKELKKQYQPDVIYIPNIKSGILLQYVRKRFKEYIPVIVGQTIPINMNSKSHQKIKDIDNYWQVQTTKWIAYIPKSLLAYKEQKILILDNLAITGNFIQIITRELIAKGISQGHIETACVATTEAAVKDNTAPRFYYRELLNAKDTYMPWGD